MIVIYSITNVLNNKRYIGSSKNFKKRKSHHIYSLNNNKHHSSYLQNAWNKYGEQSFVIEILEKIENLNILLEKEQWYLDNTNCEYNMSKLAGTNLGIKWSEESKLKFSKIRKGFIMSEETKRKISKSKIEAYKEGMIHPMTNKNHTNESKEKIKLFRLGKKHSEYTKNKIIKTRILNNNLTNKKILKYNKDNVFIEEFNSISEASNIEKISRSSISNCLTNRSKTAGGYIWKYKV